MAKKSLQPLEILRLLPRTNCKKCGCLTCYAFAFDLVARAKRPEDCPELLKEEAAESYRALKEMIGEGERIKGTDHILDSSKCTGCGDCVAVCNRALTTVTRSGHLMQREPVPPALKVIDGCLHVIEWSSCKRSVPGLDICNLCADKCPFGALELVKQEEDEED